MNLAEPRLVYVVMGSTGEHSSRVEWLVRAFIVKTAAQRYAEECQRIADEWEASNPGYFRSEQGKHLLDPHFRTDYTGTRYFVNSCPLEGV